MILIREGQKPTRHAPIGEISQMTKISREKKTSPHLKNIKGRETFADGKPIVQFIVDDQLRRRPVMQEPCRIPAFPVLARGPESATQVVVGEVLLVTGHLVGHAKDAVVADEGFELAT